MSCNCINEIKEDIRHRFDVKEEVERVDIVSIENLAMMLLENGNMQTQAYSPVKVEYNYKNKKGELKHKKGKVNLSYKYCPFCGKKYEE